MIVIEGIHNAFHIEHIISTWRETVCPGWREHVEKAKYIGVDPVLAKNVSQFLDLQKPHKRIHYKDEGILLCGALWGWEGMVAASKHMYDDLVSEAFKKLWKREVKAWIKRMGY